MNIRARLRTLKTRQFAPDRGRGQSLVEMALLTPLLLLMLLGVLEVGWALRGYLVLANANREATRFAARGRYLDFNQTTPETIGYPVVVSHTYASLADTLPVDLAPSSTNGGIIVSHYVVNTGQPCIEMDTCVCSEDAANFDADNAGNIADYDDKFQGPGPAWSETAAWRYNSRPDDPAMASRLDDAALRKQLTDENNVFNCNLYKKDSSMPWSINSVVAVELFYDQPQLLGLFNTQSILGRPIIPDPIPFYTHTTMRITADARTGGKKRDTEGCVAWPIALDFDTLPEQSPPPSVTLNVWNDGGAGNFGWLRWPTDPNANNATYLDMMLRHPELSTQDYVNANDPDDHDLSEGDYVSGNPGVSNSDDVRDDLAKMASESYGRTVVIPIYDSTSGTGSNLTYHIWGFATVKILDSDLAQGTDKDYITAELTGFSKSCPGAK
jgi:hypothetical protein